MAGDRGIALLRIEDVDTPRSVVGSDRIMLAQLINCGLLPDEPPLWQSRRGDIYARALQSLRDQLRVYACACSRRDIEMAWEATGQVRMRHGELVYPGTCRHGLKGKQPRAWRLRCTNDDDSDLLINWFDRRLGAQTQNVTQSIGDIVLQRTDGLWAYQMAVVVDDADQGVTHVVRGGDMTESTPRQIHLQRALGFSTPHYLHTPVVMAADGQKLSKQNGAEAIDVSQPLAALRAAGDAWQTRISRSLRASQSLAGRRAALRAPAAVIRQPRTRSPGAGQALCCGGFRSERKWRNCPRAKRT